MLYNVPPTLTDLSEDEKENWNDVRGRAIYAGMLITNQMKGALDMMTEATYPGQKGQHPEFGEEILKLAGEICGGGDDDDDDGDGKGEGEGEGKKKKKNNKKNNKKKPKTNDAA